MADYFDQVEAEVQARQARHPAVVLPWSWWREQAERHGMSPHAVYTRAVKSGLYTPPAKRNGAASPTGPAARPEAVEPRHNGAEHPTIREGSEPPSRPPASRRDSVDLRSSRAPASRELAPGEGGLGSAVQGFAGLVERASRLEGTIDGLNREIDALREENSRLRAALEAVEEHAYQILRSARTHP